MVAPYGVFDSISDGTERLYDEGSAACTLKAYGANTVFTSELDTVGTLYWSRCGDIVSISIENVQAACSLTTDNLGYFQILNFPSSLLSTLATVVGTFPLDLSVSSAATDYRATFYFTTVNAFISLAKIGDGGGNGKAYILNPSWTFLRRK